MKDRFMQLLADRLALPSDALDAFAGAEDKLFSDTSALRETERLKALFFSDLYEKAAFLDAMDKLAEGLQLHRFTFHMLFLMYCAEELHDKYAERKVPEWVYWNTMDDLNYKINECHEVDGVWGTSTFSWFHGFYNMTRFALGRLQYDIVTSFKFPPWEREDINWKVNTTPPFKKGGAVLAAGGECYNVHIPSSGPLTRELRMQSYKLAFDFFGMKEKERPLPLICTSWILYPGQSEFLPPQSNILDFMSDFDIAAYYEHEMFTNAWRVFGKDHMLPPEKLPRNTALQRAYAGRLMEGKPVGTGMGILFFDGERII